jgi:hypothetical protein
MQFFHSLRTQGTFLFIPLIVLCCCASGCSSSIKTAKSKDKTLQEYEKEFDPSMYRPNPPNKVKKPEPAAAATRPARDTARIQRMEKVMGFRVQVYSTTDLDEAMRMKEAYQAKFDSLSLKSVAPDIEYDAPYYKIRAGNFTQKKQADEMKDALKRAGINEAWVVRASVIRATREIPDR